MKKIRLKILLLIFLMCSLILIVFIRYGSIQSQENIEIPYQADQPEMDDVFTQQKTAPVMTAEPVPAPNDIRETPAFASEDADTKDNELNTKPAVSQSESSQSDGRRYTEKTYQLVTDIVFSFKNNPDDWDSVQSLLNSLRGEDNSLGITWQNIMDYWLYTRTEMSIENTPPDHLPDNDGLCIVVLGYQLFSDGSMTSELSGRCEKALLCVQKYPAAYLAVCGGGTAALNKNATEARVMADWFIANGVSPEKLILEDRSQTTVENAVFLHQILPESYPQIHDLLIVSSDYHIPVSCLLFSAESFLSEWKTGIIPYKVVGNTAYETNGDETYTSISTQAQYLWSLADPTY